jgi:hypothetical protein
MVRIIAEEPAEKTESSEAWPATGHSLGRHAGEEAGAPHMPKTEEFWRGAHSQRMWVQPDVLTLFSGSVGSFSANVGSWPVLVMWFGGASQVYTNSYV